LTEEEAQLVILAIAELAVARPGWLQALERVAGKFKTEDRTQDGLTVFYRYLEMRAQPLTNALSGEDENFTRLDFGYPPQNFSP
jgi:hypothetical protein